MRVLFLDFDGVLNGCAQNKGQPIEGAEFGNEYWGASQLSQALVTQVNRIFDETRAVVVLTTSWHLVHPTRYLRNMLEILGFKGFIIGCTPDLHGDGIGREHEIEAWLEATGPAVTSYCILDDWHMGHLSSHAVHTDVRVGVTAEEVEEAIRILLGPS